MSMEGLDALVAEVREDYQIPPYFPDSALKRLVIEGAAYFQMLNPGCDFESDIVYRDLLKNRTYYAYNHALNDFRVNYHPDILSWQAMTPTEGGDSYEE